MLAVKVLRGWRRVVPWLVLALVGVGLGGAIGWGGAQNRWCGGSDSASTLIVARNLLAGRGFTVDHIMFFVPVFPSISHPENAFPLLHPTLVAAIGLLTRDVFTAAHLLQGAFVLLYVGVLPIIALRRYGALPAIAFAAALIAQERWTLFDRPLNDSGATVLFACAALEAMRTLELNDQTRRASAWRRVAVFAALATSFKASVTFFVLGLLAGALVLDRATPLRSHARRWAWVLGMVACAHVPVAVWHYLAHDRFGVPQNVEMRSFVRTVLPGDGFWLAWERSRTYFPAHPDEALSFSALLAKRGFLAALLSDPLSRMFHAARDAYVSGAVLPLPWVVAAASSAKLARPNCAARLLLFGIASSLFIAAYSHYESRYFQPLRPLVALMFLEAVRRAVHGLGAENRDRLALGACLGYALLVAGGILGFTLGYGKTLQFFAFFALAVFGLYVAYRAIAGRGGAHTAPALALALLVMLGLGVPAGTRALVNAFPPRSDRDAALGAFVARNVPPGAPVMTRQRVEISLFSERPTVVTPFHTQDVCAAARRYAVEYLLVGPKDRAMQPDLALLVESFPAVGRLDGTVLYRVRC